MFDQWWVLIPIVAILAGVVTEWLKVRGRQQVLGASTRELDQELEQMRKEQAVLRERVQNLEAIVVSQTWDAVNSRGLSEAERELKIASTARRELAAPEPEAVNQQRAEQLARRLQA